MELVGVGLDAVLLQHLRDYLRHRQVLEDALVAAVAQVAELRHDGDCVAGQTLAGLALGNPVDQAVNTQVIGAEGEKSRQVQQALQVEIRALADQLNLEAIGLADRLATAELEHLQVVFEAFDAQAEMGFIGRVEHAHFLVKRSSIDAVD